VMKDDPRRLLRDDLIRRLGRSRAPFGAGNDPEGLRVHALSQDLFGKLG
jgi:hypothetical protein